MSSNFTHTVLGRTGICVHRLGLSATYRPGKRAIYRAIDEGANFFFAFGVDTQMRSVLRDVFKSKRQGLVLATGAYNLLIGYPNLRRTLEKRLRQFGTDCIDVFLFLGVTKPKHFPEEAREELYRFRQEGKVRFVGISAHDRKFIGTLAAGDELDVFMLRYNAAHRGAEKDIFPYLDRHNPGVVAYTATRWTALMRRHKDWPRGERVPAAGMAYRFVLTHPNVHVCLTAPTNLKQLEENIAALRQGPLGEEEMQYMRRFGDTVYMQRKWFM
ncbi:MAG: aldo/keto reductase [Ignavibacteria bacterium]|nr:aldo/keto reductase [Ignavibacteria bacterium]